MAWLWWAFSCNQSSFTSSNDAKNPNEGNPSDQPSRPADPDSSPAPNANPSDRRDNPSRPTTNDCIDGDKASFNPGGEAGKCISAGNTYNFDSRSCQKMRRANFDCTFEGLFEALKEMGLAPTEKLRKFKNEGAKIISCGENQNKSLVVSQILVPPEGGFKCENGTVKTGTVLTGCYQTEDGLQEGASEDARKAYVYSCIEKTND